MSKKSTAATQINYESAAAFLERTFLVAEANVASGANAAVPSKFQDSVSVLFSSKTQSFREALLGCALVRFVNRTADLTLPYVNQGPRAYNGRTMDERVVNPFLHDRQVPASKGPYLAAFRRSVKFDLNTRIGARDKVSYDAFLEALSQLTNAKSDADIEVLLLYLLAEFVRLRDSSKVTLAKINRLNLDQYETLFDELLKTSSGGVLPVLLTVAMFQTIREAYSLAWEITWQGINVSDQASGAGGDVTVSEAGQTICAIEVTERPISRARVVSTFNTKISPAGISDYMFVFSGAAPAKDARELAGQYFNQGHDVNFVDITPWLLHNLATLGSSVRTKFTRNFLTLLGGQDVSASLKVKWNDLVKKLFL